jgi:UDP-2,4-diacetamido-2,4,6-trideoxy-beta-L-altropyranose hydrolase
LIDLIEQRGHHVLVLPALHGSASPTSNRLAHDNWLGTNWATDAQDTKEVLRTKIGDSRIDWLIVDHYALDALWEQALQPQFRRIMVIDDLADRPHACDLLLDQNLGRKGHDYDGLVQRKTIKLIGTKYVLLRPEFDALRTSSLTRRRSDPQLSQLLITMGGVDKDNATGRVLDILATCVLPPDLRIIVVMGSNAPWLPLVQEQSLKMPWHTQVLVNVKNMAQVMAESDLAIGAAGSTVWEMCSMGLPSLVLVLAENQIQGAAALSDVGAAIVIENVEKIRPAIENLFKPKSSDLSILIERCSQVSDGGGCVGVINAIRSLDITTRAATNADAMLLFKWANDKQTRNNAFNSDTILLSEHLLWLDCRLNNEHQCVILIAESLNQPIGQVRFEASGNEWVIDYSIAPEERGKGFGLYMLNCALLSFVDAKKMADMIAYVKMGNIASRKIFDSLGFIVDNSNSGFLTYKRRFYSVQ